jgi:FkbH-like protein
MAGIASIELQKALFARRLNSFDLMKASGDEAGQAISIRVHRNHGFEPVARALPAFLSYAGFRADIRIGAYDDGLTLSGEPADIEIVWIDFDRYRALVTADIIAWISERVAALRASGSAPILIAEAPGTTDAEREINAALAAIAARTPSLWLIPLAAIRDELGDAFFDLRRAELTATRLSNAAAMDCARRIGFSLVPQAFGRMIKAVAVDLDNTLYEGVLGEDGPEGLRLGEDHARLQERLAELSRKGVLIAVVSRNAHEDVQRLFAARTDFPLRPELVADWQVDWAGKAGGIRRAAERFRIATDAFLFVDDNAGELAAVAAELPDVKLVFAGDGAAHTDFTLEHYPGLTPAAASATGALRNADLRANEAREKIAREATTPNDYLRSLGVELTFRRNDPDTLARFAEISAKTNQFNLALMRANAAVVADYMAKPGREAIMVFLKDRLADSGSIATLLCRRDAETLVVDDLCISCRAMGRFLEDAIVAEALRVAVGDGGVRSVRFAHKPGPRNAPARAWLGAFTGRPVDGEDELEWPWSDERLSSILAATPVTIFWEPQHAHG